MTKVRVSASLSLLIPEERAFVELWRSSLPHRRQQWLREQIYLGLKSGAKVISYRSDQEVEPKLSTSNSVRIQIELDKRDSDDARAIEIYSSMSKTRRGQWLRNILLLGNMILTNPGSRLINVATMFVSMSEQETPRDVPVVELKRSAFKSAESTTSPGKLAPKPLPSSGDRLQSEKLSPPANPELVGADTPTTYKPHSEEGAPLHASALRNLFGPT